MGSPPHDVEPNPTLPPWIGASLLTAGSEHLLAAELRQRRDFDPLRRVGTAPSGDLPRAARPSADPGAWEARFAAGLEAAVDAAVAVAGGGLSNLTSRSAGRTPWESALRWFISNFPLLGALASGLRLVEKADVCERMGIAIAAVSPAAGELYVNPRAPLKAAERRFVIGHELLHAGLRHDTRSGGRDPFLWNVACDFVINGWLLAMAAGQMPEGVLYDPALKGMSAEQVYDRIACDLRRARKLRTLRGVGACDVLPGRIPVVGEGVAATDLDGFDRRALARGLELHRCGSRGLVPAGLEEAINALAHPPIAWDVDLARWFDDHFPALERGRTYARLSRRQSATPDIPRPALSLPDELVSRRTGRVRVRGRGGTVLQPGVDLLEAASDFPDDGPILVITDGACDAVRIRRDHAWLIPEGRSLPLVPHAPVFRIR